MVSIHLHCCFNAGTFFEMALIRKGYTRPVLGNRIHLLGLRLLFGVLAIRLRLHLFTSKALELHILGINLE